MSYIDLDLNTSLCHKTSLEYKSLDPSILTKAVETNLYGRDCLYIDSGEGYGIKLYSKYHKARHTCTTQAALAYLGLAPAVGNMVYLEMGPIRLCGYETEIAVTNDYIMDPTNETYSVEYFDEKYDWFLERLKSYGVLFSDMSYTNVGLLRGEMVIIDCCDHIHFL